MGTIAEKLQYTSNAVDDIQAAINEMGVDTDDTVELGYYGDKIREIATVNGNNIKDFYEIEKFEGLSKFDFAPKDFVDVNELVIVGGIEGFSTFDCMTINPFDAYSADVITAKTIEDVSDAYKF